ncbi:hypothetical protein ESCO_001988 [Escovopsis weberi]|uniref:ATPase AAA-type core domain-containing protein n=1 Tax=Escovopsis weberi TaxID=150374 RepID=A0A0M9VWM7_ESCWE|nr:hypothetical protein ESCO_001988 [Escovopsis weberi]
METCDAGTAQKPVDKLPSLEEALKKAQGSPLEPGLYTAVIKQVTSIQLFTECRDQGPSADAGKGHWTWFEVGIVGNKDRDSRSLKEKNKNPLSYKTHLNAYMSDEFVWRDGERFNKGHALIKSLEAEDSISVRLCARFEKSKVIVNTGYLVIGISEGPGGTLIHPEVVQVFQLKTDDTTSEALSAVAQYSVKCDQDLRKEGMILSYHLSWEKTMEDFRNYFHNYVDYRKMEDIHLLVRCGFEGVFYLRPKSPSEAEGDLLDSHQNLVPGINSAFLCGLTSALVQEPSSALAHLDSNHFAGAIMTALEWSHRFAAVGFRKDKLDGRINYPSSRDIRLTAPPASSIMKVDSTVMRADGDWCIFDILRPLAPLVAAKIVQDSPTMLTSLVPTAKFGGLVTADRVEIKGYRSTAVVIDEYLRGPSKKPLSIGIFGQPGSGKSFGVGQVIEAVIKGHTKLKSKTHEVNLSQLTGYSDLLTTFHTIQGIAVEGCIPVVLFDEFDSSLGGIPFGWLKYLLAPMQDAKFLEGGHERPLGRAIFVFIGGTSSTFSDFANSPIDETSKKAKKPDFSSSEAYS